ncbi:hypothetical protein EDD29_1618 [Actinocorallia herbida]|uniref:Uncharacterized protein n=2 Tax=Actinocorallia herbida TaxID=58109 RepID=A0A3N1CS11_9ACTN|nr:hypothetical protein EDD29_1618 [Actinocorallia herbida]
MQGTAPREDRGEAGVTAVLAGLDGLDALPVGGHVAVFERVHAGLQEILAASDETREAR